MNLLTPFGKLYGRVMDMRNLLYDRGVMRSYGLGARTISVGNLTTGGTGKTPLVALIAKILINEGETVCILTRGYGRKDPQKRVLVCDGSNVLADSGTGGDEPVELAHELEGKAIIVADRDRLAAAMWARERFEITTFILDDGFQHRRARRDLDFVCIDATNPYGNGQVLPAGSLRESFKSLKRSDVIVITRAEQVENTNALEAMLRTQNPDAPIFHARSAIADLISIEEFHAKTQNTQRKTGEKLAAFTGIGNPGSFFRSLEINNYDVVVNESFRDHHQFSPSDISRVESKARSSAATALVTTAKDAVRLRGVKFELPCYVALAETTVDDIDAFRKLIISSS